MCLSVVAMRVSVVTSLNVLLAQCLHVELPEVSWYLLDCLFVCISVCSLEINVHGCWIIRKDFIYRQSS